MFLFLFAKWQQKQSCAYLHIILICRRLGPLSIVEVVFFKAIVCEINNLVTWPFRLLYFTSCSQLKTALQQSLYRLRYSHAPRRAANQSKREGRHLRPILPGNMPAEKEDKQKEEEELRGEWMADTGVMEMYRDLSGLARIILNFFQIRHEHEQKLLFRSSLACLCRRWAAQKRPLFSLLRCGEHDVTRFVQPLHQNFLFCHRAAKIQCIEHTDVHRVDTANTDGLHPKAVDIGKLE